MHWIIDIKTILIYGINHLHYTETSEKIIIKMNYYLNCPNIDAKLYDICKLVNYGNLNIKGYPIFTNVFKHILNNIDFYIKA